MKSKAGPTGMWIGCARLVTLLALLAGGPAVAAGYAAQTIAGWTVAASKDGDGCFAIRTYPRRGETTLLFGLDLDGRNRLSVLNANWSIQPGDRLALDFTLSNAGYAAHPAVGIASDGKQGFVSSFERSFPSRLAASSRLSIARGRVPVERLELDGSRAAMAELQRCLAAIGPGPPSADDDIPVDPFAPTGKIRPRK